MVYLATTLNFLQNLRVNKFQKAVNIWQRYGLKSFAAYFFGLPCIYNVNLYPGCITGSVTG